MLIKSKYKLARRLGSPIFEKTQGQKYALRSSRRKMTNRKHPKVITDYGKQLTEKQKVRFTYLMPERQLKRYVGSVLNKRGIKQDEKLFEALENRLDNVAYRVGFSPTRLAARQLVTHGHLCVNKKRVNVPSYSLKIGDVVSVRQGSQNKQLFSSLEERIKEKPSFSWFKFDLVKKQATVIGVPKLDRKETSIDFNKVMDYYKR